MNRKSELQRVHIVVSGLVQGVFFRANTHYEAKRLGLTGWVRNMRGRKVEIVAEGEKNDLQELISWCRQGPPGARVENIEVKWEESTGEFSDFRISY